jgi:hypothetical protein
MRSRIWSERQPVERLGWRFLDYDSARMRMVARTGNTAGIMGESAHPDEGVPSARTQFPEDV